MIFVLMTDQVADCYNIEAEHALEYIELMLVDYGFMPLYTKDISLKTMIDYMSIEFDILSSDRPFLNKNFFEQLLTNLHKETAGNIYVNVFQRYVSDNFIFVEIFYNGKSGSGNTTVITNNQ